MSTSLVKRLSINSVALVLIFLMLSIGLERFPQRDTRQEQAYVLVFQELVESKEYVAVDLSGTKLKGIAKLEKALQSYCDENGITLLLRDFDWLEEHGYIKYSDPGPDGLWYFPGGEIIGFRDSELTKTTLVTSVSVATGDMSAYGKNYEVKCIDGTWTITKSEGSWFA